ncbi:histone-arginine methyltransferase METTL23-like [Antennarius striatus]|uniref:histone-arginine methyltransferase METTL23-like n=1 Tax=Antennarius striatus TaxID=241820 RepID=UPI0035B48919
MAHSEAETPKIVHKVFTFEEGKKRRRETLSVSIPEVLDPQYGMYVWPCAAVLAQYVWTNRKQLKDKTVLEIGAGVSLPGVVAALCGAKVILSDNAQTPMCLENCRRSCDANGLGGVAVVGLTWGEVSPDLVLLPALDVILGSDVFYDPQEFESVIVTIAFLLRKNPRAQFWTTYQERSADWSIEVLLHRWKLSCVEVELETFDADKAELAGSSLPGKHSIQMMIITRKTDGVGPAGAQDQEVGRAGAQDQEVGRAGAQDQEVGRAGAQDQEVGHAGAQDQEVERAGAQDQEVERAGAQDQEVGLIGTRMET